jgi:hypothetical protein
MASEIGSAGDVMKPAYPIGGHTAAKAGATVGAGNRVTDRQLIALYDWTSAKQANVYTLVADRKRLASEAADHLAGYESQNRKEPLMIHLTTKHR